MAIVSTGPRLKRSAASTTASKNTSATNMYPVYETSPQHTLAIAKRETIAQLYSPMIESDTDSCSGTMLRDLSAAASGRTTHTSMSPLPEMRASASD